MYKCFYFVFHLNCFDKEQTNKQNILVNWLDWSTETTRSELLWFNPTVFSTHFGGMCSFGMTVQLIVP